MIFYKTFNGTEAALNPDHIVSAVETEQGLRVETITGNPILLRNWAMGDLRGVLVPEMVRLDLSASQQEMV